MTEQKVIPKIVGQISVVNGNTINEMIYLEPDIPDGDYVLVAISSKEIEELIEQYNLRGR